MEIVIRSTTNNNYAMNPQIEQRLGRRQMRMVQHGCQYFLIFSSPLHITVDLHDEQFQAAICSMGGELLKASNARVPGYEDVRVTCISFMIFRRDNEYIELPDKAACYAVCGCIQPQGEDTLCVLIPAEKMNYTTSVAVELHYKAVPYVKTVRHMFRTVQEPTPFYAVTFEDKSNFVSGSVIYTIGNNGSRPCRYPVTEQMMGRTVLIRTDGEIPRFEALTRGIILKND